MLKVITDNEKTKVIYDSEKKIYKKTFYKNKRLRMRLREYFGLKEYPGINFKKVTDLLTNMNGGGINCPKIVSYEKYEVITEEIKGISLRKYIESHSKEESEKILEIYIENVSKILKKIIKKNIYYNDFHFENFIITPLKEMYIIDLEGYTKDLFFLFHKKKMLKGILRIISEEKILREKNINPELIYYKIIEKIS